MQVECDQCGNWVECPIPAWQDEFRQLKAEIERLRAENQQLRERQETQELRNLPQWKPSITPEALK